MIPADLVSRLRLQLPEQPAPARPVVPAQELSDVLRDVVPGQRILAEIQALLPNGSYRAVVGQRDLTLALPFSAKAGDTLELVVEEHDGQLSLALANHHALGGAGAAESVSTHLSQTGQLIGHLLDGIAQQGGKAQPAPLQAYQALIESFPQKASDVAPRLKEALTQSGLFYESHQADWLAGKRPLTDLLEEPQGKLSVPPDSVGIQRSPKNMAQPLEALPASGKAEAKNAAPPAQGPHATVVPRIDTTDITPADALNSPSLTGPSQTLPPEITPLVQQQLESLATQTYAWQGQIWPGQALHWEIVDERPHTGEPEPSSIRWQTRLQLALPALGAIEARLSLYPNGQIEVTLQTATQDSQTRLGEAAQALREQLHNAGLTLTQLAIHHDQARN